MYVRPPLDLVIDNGRVQDYLKRWAREHRPLLTFNKDRHTIEHAIELLQETYEYPQYRKPFSGDDKEPDQGVDYTDKPKGYNSAVGYKPEPTPPRPTLNPNLPVPPTRPEKFLDALRDMLTPNLEAQIMYEALDSMIVDAHEQIALDDPHDPIIHDLSALIRVRNLYDDAKIHR